MYHVLYPTDFENNEDNDLEIKLMDKPEAFISISAMCNQKEDHHLLAALVLELQKIMGGWINLNGAIVPPLLKNEKGEYIPLSKREEELYVQSIPGSIHEIEYKVDEKSQLLLPHCRSGLAFELA